MAATLEEFRGFLISDGGTLLAENLREAHLEEADRLLAKAREPGEVLYVGILGGTGVGKSTLINALARADISDPSDRRPFTDRAVVYRHRDTPRGLEGLAEVIREGDAVHEIEAIKDLVLLDLPDFDSVEGENRRAVERILPSLDAIVWVVSPEKYADAVFYALVGQTAMHRDNFTFVLNKTDELIDEGGTDPYARLKEVMGDLAFRLKHDVGIEDPRIFSLSAAQEREGSVREGMPALEFKRFRDFLMVRRDAKEIASVKTINLVEEMRQILAEVNSEIRPREKAAVIRAIAETSPDDRREENVPELTRRRLETEITASVFPLLAANDASIGPVKAAMRLLTLGRRFTRGLSGSRLEERLEEAVLVLGRQRRMELEKVAAQMDSELLLAFPHSLSVRTIDGPDRLVAQAVKEGTALFQLELEKQKRALQGFSSRFRRLWQKLVLFIPLVLLVTKLAGHEHLRAWADEPTFSGVLTMFLGILTSLFGAEGLIGLAVFLICEGILIGFMGARRMGKLERAAEKLARSAIDYLESSLDSVCTRMREQRRDALEGISRGIDRLNRLTSSFDSADLKRSLPITRLRQGGRAS